MAVGVFFPIYINTYHGIRSVDPQLIEMGKSYGLSRWQLYKEIILPGAMPYFSWFTFCFRSGLGVAHCS